MRRTQQLPAANATGRDRILAVALRLVADKGHEAVSVREIAKRSHAAYGLVAHHFGSREGLLDALDDFVLHELQRLLADFEFSYEHGLDQRKVAEAVSRMPSLEIIAYVRQLVISNRPRAQDACNAIIDRARRITHSLDRDGHLRPDVDKDWLIIEIASLFIGPVVLSPFLDLEMDSAEAMGRSHRAHVSLIWRGACVPEAPAADDGRAIRATGAASPNGKRAGRTTGSSISPAGKRSIRTARS